MTKAKQKAQDSLSREEQSVLSDLSTGLSLSLYSIPDYIFASLKKRGLLRIQGQQLELTLEGVRVAEGIPCED